ncbi:MAG: nucleotide sugar dehydrogenase [Gammaproteobacteria bacterium]
MINKKIAVVGLGYVGLPLSVEFGKKLDTIGFDIKNSRIRELQSNYDNTGEVSPEELKAAKFLKYSSDPEAIQDCNIFIVTAPTPIDEYKTPNLKPLELATITVGKYLKKGDIVIYESTVYPGATEEICVPLLEEYSGLTFNTDFYCGYSPERINPGDKNHKLTMIKKVTSGSTPEAALIVDNLYKLIITEGTYKAENIKVAEAAKVIENTQRDVNIALINELAIIFNKLEIDTESVLRAAETKWNFLPFRPGLVGGHCIGVDPYYLTHKAITVGFSPNMILAGRRINDGMGNYVANQVSQLMVQNRINLVDSYVLVMGLSFKENSKDIRNTGVADLVNTLKGYNCNVEVYDPLVNHEEAINEYDITLIKRPSKNKYDAIVIAVAHDEFKQLSILDIKAYAKKRHIIYDIKHIFKQGEVDGRL